MVSSPPPLCTDPGQAPFLDQSSVCAEADLPAQGQDLPPDALHHVDQHVRADVGLGVIADALRRAVGGELLQHPGMRLSWVPVFSFPSEKVPAPPSPNWTLFSGSSRSAGAEGVHRGLAAEGVLPPLEHQGLCPGPGQHQRGEHPRRAEAHHHRALRQAAPGIS